MFAYGVCFGGMLRGYASGVCFGVCFGGFEHYSTIYFASHHMNIHDPNTSQQSADQKTCQGQSLQAAELICTLEHDAMISSKCVSP